MYWSKRRTRVALSLAGIAVTMFLISMTIGRELIEGGETTLVSYAIINFAGYLFILLMPVEALVPLYVAEGHNGFAILAIALGTLMVAQVINYTVGRLMSEEIIHSLIGEKRYSKIKNKILDYGPYAVLIMNIFPLASSILSLTAGMVKFGMKRLLIYTFIGSVIKYSILIFFFDQLMRIIT
jgi:membrane protein DedA with SNARE-associated domain